MRAQLQFQVNQRGAHFALKLLARKQQLCEFLAAISRRRRHLTSAGESTDWPA
jgi:hypothetical protein